MSDDIVTRLHEIAYEVDSTVPMHLTEAAREIERLRAELAHAQTEIARLERLATNG